MTASALVFSPSEPLSALFGSSEPLTITATASAMSFDWSDFPVLEQYNVVLPSAPCVPVHYAPQPSTPTTNCYYNKPTFAWELEDEEDTCDSSVSSDEDSYPVTVTAKPLPKRRSGKTTKSVTFSSVLEIHSHPVVLGSHPCCSSGLALELGWDCDEEEFVDFDLYERCRHRRSMTELRLSYWQRRALLEESTGLSESELLLQEQKAWREQRWPSSSSAQDKAPAAPQSSSSFKKVSSTKTLSSLAL